MKLSSERLRVIAVLAAVAGIIGLYFYSMSIEPEHVSISEVEEHVGEYVVVQGRVVESYNSGGGTSLTLSENTSNATVRVFLDSHEKLEVGDRVEVMGKVEEYHGGYSISVQGSGYLKVLQKWESRQLTLPVLAQNPWEYRGMNLNLSCRIRYWSEDGKDSYFVVEYKNDDNESDNYMTVYISNITVSSYSKGTYIFLNARLEYSTKSFRFYLVMDSPEHHIWPDRVANAMEKNTGQ